MYSEIFYGWSEMYIFAQYGGIHWNGERQIRAASVDTNM